MDLNDKSNIAPYERNTKGDIDPPNIVSLLNARQYGLPRRGFHQLKRFAELKTATSKMQETHCKLPQSVRSTFLMTFSHDCSKVASTHGDHNIYISDVKSGNHLMKLEGHPRTPWCIAFHPESNDILASGCLAGEVRVWDLHGGSEVWKTENDQVIASLAFHPFLQILVIATGSCLYFWEWSQSRPVACVSTNSDLERVRYVKFDRHGYRLITGISNIMGCTSSNCFRPHNPEPSLLQFSDGVNLEVDRSRRTVPDTNDNDLFQNQDNSSRDRSATPTPPGIIRIMNNLMAPSALPREDYGRVLDMWHTQAASTPVPSFTPEPPRSELDIESILEEMNADSETNHIVQNDEAHETEQTGVSDEHSYDLEPVADSNSDDSESEVYDTEDEFQSEPLAASEPELNDTIPVPNFDLPTADQLVDLLLGLRDVCADIEGLLIRHLDEDLEHIAGPSISNAASVPADLPALLIAAGMDDDLPEELLESDVEGEHDEIQPSLHGAVVHMLSEIRYAVYSPGSVPVIRDRVSRVCRKVRQLISRIMDEIEVIGLEAARIAEIASQLSDQMDRLLHADSSLAISMDYSQNLDESSNKTSQGMSENSEPSISNELSSNERTRYLRQSNDEARGPSTSGHLPANSPNKRSRNLKQSPDEEQSPSTSQLSGNSSNKKMKNQILMQCPGEQSPSTSQQLPERSSIEINVSMGQSPGEQENPSTSHDMPENPEDNERPRRTVIIRRRIRHRRRLRHHPNNYNEILLNDEYFNGLNSYLDSEFTRIAVREQSSAHFQHPANITAMESDDEVTNNMQMDLDSEMTRRNSEMTQRNFADDSRNDGASSPEFISPQPLHADLPQSGSNGISDAQRNDSGNGGASSPEFVTPQQLHADLPQSGSVGMTDAQRNDSGNDGASSPELISPQQSYANLPQSGSGGISNEQRNVSRNDGDSSPEFGTSQQLYADLPQSGSNGISVAQRPQVTDSDSDRPITPPVLMHSPTYSSFFFNGSTRIGGLNDSLTQNHRIQCWDFTQQSLPAIYDATLNVVVPRCMIHNDASVDISDDGEKLVALIPSSEHRDEVHLMFAIYSLKSRCLGKTHCVFGYIYNAISVSFSPLSQYVIVGNAYTRPRTINPEKPPVAQIIKINQNNESFEPVFIRCYTQMITNENRFQDISLNCVRFLPQSGLGIAYATNRGCLSICKPTSGELFESSGELALLTGRRHGPGIRIFRSIP